MNRPAIATMIEETYDWLSRGSPDGVPMRWLHRVCMPEEPYGRFRQAVLETSLTWDRFGIARWKEAV